MPTIKTMLSRLSFQDFVSLAEQAERERLANERLERIEAAELGSIAARAARAAREKQEIMALHRPEYIYIKNAQTKEKRYQKHIRFANFEREHFKRGLTPAASDSAAPSNPQESGDNTPSG